MAQKKIEKIINVYMQSKGAIRPHTFISGPSGSGKTYTVEAVAEKHGVKVLHVNSAQITNEGLAGNSLSKTLVGLKEYQKAPVVVFFDEFDKVLEQDASLTAGNVQNEVLKMLEDPETEVIGDYGHYVRVSTENVLFFFAGSFGGAHLEHSTDLLEHGMRPELHGRIPIHVHVQKPSLEAILRGIQQSTLLKEYAQIEEGKNYADCVNAISSRAAEVYENTLIGMRLINALIHEYFIEGGFPEPPVRKQRGFGRRLDAPEVGLQLAQ